MAYVGAWGRADFDRYAPDGDGGALFRRTVQGAEHAPWDHLRPSAAASSIRVYMFRCPACGAVCGHWDMD
jgi:hypothetical protein